MRNKQETQSSLVRLALLMKPHVGKLLICVICVVIVNLAELLKPYVAAIVIDNFLVGEAGCVCRSHAYIDCICDTNNLL